MKKHFQFSEKEILLLTFFCVALVLFLFVMLPHLVPNSAPKVPALEISDDLKDNALLHELTSVSSVCFVGDSVTYGAGNGGFPWYDPLLPYITAKVENVSLGGWTTLYLLAASETIPSCELYVIAIGTNDVLVNDPAPFIEERFEEESQDHYLLDWIHPNYQYGVPLYCEAVLRGCK